MKKALQPKFIVPVILSVSIFAALLAFGNPEHVVAAMKNFKPIYLLWTLLLFGAYEIIRGWQWLYLLDRLGLKKKRRAQWFAFAVGEVAKGAPIGNYLQNYVLNVTEDEDLGTTSAATTMMVLAEVAAALTGLVVIGLGPWTFYLRIIIVGGSLIAGFVGWLIVRHHASFSMPRWIQNHTTARKIMHEARKLGDGLIGLLNWKILLIAYVNAVLYLICGGIALYMTAEGLGINVPLLATLSVYLLSLAATLIVPVPTDLGATELTGTGAFLIVGLSRTAAVSVEIIYRVLSIGSSILFALVLAVVLREQVSLTLKKRATPQTRERASGSSHARDTGREVVSLESVEDGRDQHERRNRCDEAGRRSRASARGAESSVTP